MAVVCPPGINTVCETSFISLCSKTIAEFDANLTVSNATRSSSFNSSYPANLNVTFTVPVTTSVPSVAAGVVNLTVFVTFLPSDITGFPVFLE